MDARHGRPISFIHRLSCGLAVHARDVVSRSWRGGLAGLLLAAIAATPLLAAAPADPALAEKVAAAFSRFDVDPPDGVLTGREAEPVAGYDTDKDGTVTAREFLDGYTTRKPAAVWSRHEFRSEGFSCEMPGQPKHFDETGLVDFQVASWVGDPPILLMARVRDMPSRAAGKPELLFDSVAELLEKSEAKVLDRRPANLDLYPGCEFHGRRADGSDEMVRSVVVRRMVYELDAVLPPGATEADVAMVRRFLDSLEIIR